MKHHHLKYFSQNKRDYKLCKVGTLRYKLHRLARLKDGTRKKIALRPNLNIF